MKNDASPVAVHAEYCMRADMENAPLGKKIQLINLGGVLVTGTLTNSTRDDYLEWQEIPRRAKHNPNPSQRPRVDTQTVKD